IQYSYPAPTIIVLGGEGMREGAIDWLKERVTDNHNLLAVYSLDRFIAWANKNL
ncbi:MAG: PD-(D/E)XK nuclease superfamily protein, partial [Scytonema sp. PMC 1069.18]|nr:PD-(D/E)XK nuclease superfamily protein [Scytonema sp. PMC 1069.18]